MSPVISLHPRPLQENVTVLLLAVLTFAVKIRGLCGVFLKSKSNLFINPLISSYVYFELKSNTALESINVSASLSFIDLAM